MNNFKLEFIKEKLINDLPRIFTFEQNKYLEVLVTIKAIEIGCGTGGFTRGLIKELSFGSALGIDPYSKCIDFASKLTSIEEVRLGINFFNAKLDEMVD